MLARQWLRNLTAEAVHLRRLSGLGIPRLHCGSSRTMHATASAASSETAPPYMLESFKDFAPAIKRVALQIHPDVMHRHGEAAVGTNEAALQDIFRLLDLLRIRTEALEAGVAPPVSPLDRLEPEYTFSFFVADNAAGVTQRDVVVQLPLMLDDRLNLMAQRGLLLQARAQYMAAARDAVQQLLDAVRVPLRLQLGSLLAGHEKSSRSQQEAPGAEASKKKAKVPGTGSVPSSGVGGVDEAAVRLSAKDAMTRHLIRQSPLQQGKRAAEDAAGLARDGLHVFADDKRSPYTLRERRLRALRLMALPAFLSSQEDVPDADMRAVAARLLEALTAHHDALQLYEEAWAGVQLCVTPPPARGQAPPGGAFRADLRRRTFFLPANFEQGTLVTFLCAHFPRLLESARQSVRRRASELRGRLETARGAAATASAAASAAEAEGQRHRPAGGGKQASVDKELRQWLRGGYL